jgi:hypothetical protein
MPEFILYSVKRALHLTPNCKSIIAWYTNKFFHMIPRFYYFSFSLSQFSVIHPGYFLSFSSLIVKRAVQISATVTLPK